MENASKALIMAGSVLIALMIIGALLLMFNGLSSYQQVGEQNTREAQVVAFNNQFETYNRQDVRGSDLYSLVNRVVDYNRRKSTEGTGNDEGQYLAYEPMKVEFTMNSITELSADGTKRLIRDTNYTINSTTNTFKSVYDGVTELENIYGKQVLQNLCTAKDKIFISSTDTNDKIKAINNFNSACGEKKIIINNTNNNLDIEIAFEKMLEYKKDVYTYYEYIQFKRARFKCTNTEYNKTTGRINYMQFEFTGKFE